LEAQARADGKGIWASGDKGDVETEYEVSDPKALVEEFKDRQLDAVVERVLNGDRALVRLFLGPNRHLQTVLAVAGVRAPASRRVGAELPLRAS
jgi:staphylococcal nuclease domain-containing protein 1